MANVAADSDETRRSVGSELEMTAQKTAKSLAPITVRVHGGTFLCQVFYGGSIRRLELCMV